MNILGLSAFYHDSAACLVQDGVIVAAAQEERFTRKKHDERFPASAIEYCLREGGIDADAIDYVAFYDKPYLKLDRLLETYLAFAPSGLRSFRKAIAPWLKQKLRLPSALRAGLGGRYRGRFVFLEHHESHAASAFFPSPYEHAAVLTIDGVGEWSTSTLGEGRGNKLQLARELRFPHSLGLLYSALTYFTGFKVNSGEYKLMGLAPYGEPRFAQAIYDHLLDLKADGSFRLDLRYFNYCQGLTMTSPAMDALFGGPPRKPESPITQREMDLAASIQAVTEEVMLRSARHLAKTTGARHLTMAGGVALNCVGNGKILADGCFEDVWVQPAAGDAGGALGAALFVWHQLLGKPRTVDGVHDAQRASLLGPRYVAAEVDAALGAAGAVYRRVSTKDALDDEIARHLAAGKVIGLFRGRMEFGPRALGARSIIGDARSPAMQSVMNLKIKFRESFRPFAPAVLRDRVADWFEMRPGQSSPYMLLVAPVRADRRLAPTGADDLFGIDRLKEARSTIPAVTHVDYSARVQTVDEENELFFGILRRFEALTGCPVVINTSFNIRGEPIVCTPAEAYNCFLGCDMDVLVVEDCILLKEEQPNRLGPAEVAAYQAQFALD